MFYYCKVKYFCRFLINFPFSGERLNFVLLFRFESMLALELEIDLSLEYDFY